MDSRSSDLVSLMLQILHCLLLLMYQHFSTATKQVVMVCQLIEWQLTTTWHYV